MKKINEILKKYEPNENKRVLIQIYLSVVLFGKSFDEVALSCKLPYTKVRSIVTHLAFQLKHNRNFYLLMRKVFTDVYKDNQLKLVA